jgi:hypothetical protein
MRPHRLSSLRFARLFTLANALFWLIFAILFVAKSYPYRPHEKVFEELGPDYIYFGRALSALENEHIRVLERTTQLVQAPSFYAARPYLWYCKSRGIVVDRLYWGISAGGYHLILAFVLSFFQWYLIGLFVDWIKHRLAGKPSHSTDGSHTYDAPA